MADPPADQHHVRQGPGTAAQPHRAEEVTETEVHPALHQNGHYTARYDGGKICCCLGLGFKTKI